jgi:hypothetical protein
LLISCLQTLSIKLEGQRVTEAGSSWRSVAVSTRVSEEAPIASCSQTLSGKLEWLSATEAGFVQCDLETVRVDGLLGVALGFDLANAFKRSISSFLVPLTFRPRARHSSFNSVTFISAKAAALGTAPPPHTGIVF